MPAPTFVDTESETGTSRTSITFSWTDFVGEADDDVVVAVLYKESTAAYTATPTGWTQVTGFPQDVNVGGFKYRADAWWRRVSGDTGTAVWSWSGATWAFLSAAGYRGVITSETPTITIGFDAETAQNDQPSNPGITIARSNSGLLWFSWNFNNSNSTPPTGFTERDDVTGGGNASESDDLTTVTGATGTISATLVDPEYASSVLIEIATEAGGGGGAEPPLFMLMGVGA